MSFDEEENDDNGWIDDGAEYSPKSEFSKPEVVEEAVKRSAMLRAKEMRAGYFNTTFTKDGMMQRNWIEDSRKAYISSVKALRAILYPEIIADKDYKIIEENHIFDKYAYSPLIAYTTEEGNIKYRYSDAKWIPEIDEGVMVKKIFPDGTEQVINIKGYWNSKVNAYWDSMVDHYDKVFEQLISVAHRLNYFKQQVRFG